MCSKKNTEKWRYGDSGYTERTVFTPHLFLPQNLSRMFWCHTHTTLLQHIICLKRDNFHTIHIRKHVSSVFTTFFTARNASRAKYLLQPDFVHNRNRLPEKMFPPETYSQQKTSHTKPISNQKQLAAIIFCSATKNIGTHHERKFQTKFDDAKCFCIWIHWLEKMLTI